MTSDSFRKRSLGGWARRGFSLIEFAIVLGIMGSVLGAMWGVVSIVNENVKRGEMSEQMIAMVSNVRSFYMGRARVADGAALSDADSVTDYLLRQGILLPEQIRSRTAATWVADHPWGATGASGAVLAHGGIGVSGFSVAGTDVSTNAFLIELRGLKYASCVALATKLSGPNPMGLIEVHINNTLTSPVTPDSAAVSCEDLPAENTLSFLYTLRDQQS